MVPARFHNPFGMSSNKRPRLSLEDKNDAGAPRLTRACAECKKHKIKCFVQPGKTSCNKCLKSGIHCVPHNFAQKFIDEDTAWKAEASATIDRLKDAVEHLLHHNNLPDLAKYDGTISLLRDLSNHDVAPSQQHNRQRSVQTVSPLTTDHSATSVDPSGSANFTSEGPSAGFRGHQDDSELVPLPMNNLYNLTDPDSSRLIRVDPADVNGPDLISQGVLTLAEAEFLFGHYRDCINPLLWDGMLCAHRTLEEVRQSSSLLVAVVLTVAALHIPNRERSLHAAYSAFVSLMRGSCLLRCQNLDIIRALCIGAFYITSLSWALCSRAVRVATEMNLHKSSLEFARGSLKSYERLRLWYVLYVCDHQFALAYGRPPLMHEDAAIRNAEKLLTSGLSSKGDYSVVAQVKLFRILASAYFMYGCDADLELACEDFEKLQEFNLSADQWRLEYQSRGPTTTTSSTRDGSSSPSKATVLYYHLARFQLNSVSLRGISGKGVSSSQDATSGLDMNWDRQEASNAAITAAMNTARLIIDDVDLQKALIGLPIFAHAMIAVCASFLLKMAVAFGEPDSNNNADVGSSALLLPRDLIRHGLNFHTKTALTMVQRLVHVLGQVADNASQRHVARQVVTGLGELLQRFTPGRDTDTFTYALARGNASRDPGAASASMSAPRRTLPIFGLNDRDAFTQRYDGGASGSSGAGGEIEQTAYYDVTSSAQVNEGMQAGLAGSNQQDPFDLTGDLDWRFDDGFLLGIDAVDSELAFL